MTNEDQRTGVDRRSFLKQLAIGGAAVVATGCSRGAMPGTLGAAGGAATAASLRDRIGLQLYTVRDLTATDYPGTLMRVAQIGYREVQTTGSYGSYTAAQIHQFLDAAKLVSPATHVSPRMGPDFERTLEGYQLIGHKYTTVAFGITPRNAPSTAAAA
ncbi:MAG: Xylose isomerase protein barrel, partial [Gemmatimonadetes bacterium]|nr:Xylose isomerase protein barrel [Gemmatimonadota bacterium]